ncbi:MAG: 30S ribosomal protein S18 [Planctomycetes bacterium]|jgi:small subunit ribosomal protein S18|nr:30S ribosomal protein S18 [Planctomycetota bacterium]MBT4028860.1 30S ribosomal protein S18 [Planctomycetota bacterium]MBT4559580.1 30S ribosomal protein S18 [Planctomycetota bacterium]MBT5100308.1 30S ribosomal protein S18 [Planctomycetota bacterium]MBT7012868.1 30S ribosomal protein S18 [Planctomycetota bacterium]
MGKKTHKKFDFKDTEDLLRYLSGQGQISSAKRTGLSAREQRSLKRAVKNARFLGLLPFVG